MKPSAHDRPASPPRRRLLGYGAMLVAALPATRAHASSSRPPGEPVGAGRWESPDRGTAKLALVNTHTGERIDLVYRESGAYVPQALAEIDRVLRDHRTNQIAPIDPALLDLVHRLGGLLDARQPFHVISGYRSPVTNARLATAGSGVARTSLHLAGRAIDLRLPGRPLEDLRAAALQLGRGGVGYYPRSDFVHVDTGRVRAW